MKVINLDTLFKGKVEESVLVHSYAEYVALGGKRDILDMYAYVKERAKTREGEYIDLMDQYLSGIHVNEELITKKRLYAQVNWYILHLWFHKPLRVVSYTNFDLEEFNLL